jgi:WD40 repeat protein
MSGYTEFVKKIFFNLFPIVCFASLLCAQGPPTMPQIELDAGMHSASIGGISMDAAQKYLVSASSDKSLRVWDIVSLQLLQVIHAPAGETEEEGRLYTAALSPDGKTIAAGGWTGYEWDKKISVYLFDRSSGKMTRRLAGFPNIILHMVFSPDGSLLAVTMGSGGLRLFETAQYQKVGEDTDYGAESYGVDFDSQGHLATACCDGWVRFYAIGQRPAPGLKLLKKQKMEAPGLLYSVKFSPDGARLAAGFADGTQVVVLRTSDLGVVFSPDTHDVSNGHLAQVAWSQDGSRLYAAGKYRNQGQYVVRWWEEGGLGRIHEIPASSNTIMALLAHRKGGIVFASAAPALGYINDKDKKQVYLPAPLADFRDTEKSFLVSKDATTLQFLFGGNDPSPIRFSLSDRRFDGKAALAADVKPLIDRADGWNLTSWRNSYSPQLNGRILELAPNERCRSYAITPDFEHLLLGGNWYLRFYDRSAQMLWESRIPAPPWALNIAGNGKLVVAALGDGTLRWYRLSDGKLLLSFFPHPDRKRWILWSPRGYFDASPGGEQLLGWRVNRSAEQAADYFPLSQFRSNFYRPELVQQILTLLDEEQAIQIALGSNGQSEESASSQVLHAVLPGTAVKRPSPPALPTQAIALNQIAQMVPPIVELVSPNSHATIVATDLLLQYRIRTRAQEPVTAVKLLLDGRPVKMARDLATDKGESDYEKIQEIRLTVPPQDCEVSVVAENRFAASSPATWHLKWGGSAAAPEFVLRPKLYLLAIGVSQYQNPRYSLGFAAKDARDFSSLMQRQKGELYRDLEVLLLTDVKATRETILDGLNWLEKSCTHNDVAMIFIAGHGINDRNGAYYFIPPNIDPENIKRTGLPYFEIMNTVRNTAGKVLLFLDTCHAGNVMGSTARGFEVDINAMINELASAENGAVVFASTTGRQQALENESWGNGAFTKALLEGLSGKADFQGTGRVTVNMLDLYLSERVKALTLGQQTPTASKPQTISDFPLVINANGSTPH